HPAPRAHPTRCMAILSDRLASGDPTWTVLALAVLALGLVPRPPAGPRRAGPDRLPLPPSPGGGAARAPRCDRGHARRARRAAARLRPDGVRRERGRPRAPLLDSAP